MTPHPKNDSQSSLFNSSAYGFVINMMKLEAYQLLHICSGSAKFRGILKKFLLHTEVYSLRMMFYQCSLWMMMRILVGRTFMFAGWQNIHVCQKNHQHYLFLAKFHQKAVHCTSIYMFSAKRTIQGLKINSILGHTLKITQNILTLQEIVAEFSSSCNNCTCKCLCYGSYV